MTGDSAAVSRPRAIPGEALRRAGLGFGLAVLLVAAFCLALLIGLAVAYQGRVLPGVRVAGIDVSGLDRPAAAARLQAELPSLDAGRLIFQVGVQISTVPYAAIARRYDTGAMLDAAFAVGHRGSLVDQAIDEVRSVMRGTEVVARETHDASALRHLLAGALAALAQEPRSASVTLDAAAGTFVVTPAVAGQTIRPAAVQAEVESYLAGAQAATFTLRLTPTAADPTVATATAAAAAAQATALTARPLSLRVGDDTFPVERATLAGWLDVSLGPDGRSVVAFDRQRLAASLTELARKTDRTVRDATLRWSLSGVSVVPAVVGRQLDVAASTTLLYQALSAGSPDGRPSEVTLSAAVTKPDVTTASARQAASKLQLLSSWTTHFVPGEGNFWGRNISIPTSQIDGTVVAPGAWFDFWKVVTVSTALGYGPGGAIIGGHTQETGALGGGICSCSTTLFNAALRAGLQIGARMNHYYYISRYPQGLDATVYKSDGGWTQTMSFRNDTPYPILIRGINAPGRVTFQLYGVSTGRRVVLSAPTIKNRHAASDEVQYTTSLKPGVKERVEWPADGFDAWVTRTVYDAGGAVIHHETFYSHYATITGLTLVGRAASSSPPPTAPPSSGPTPKPSPSPRPTPSPTPQPTPHPTPSPSPQPSASPSPTP
ncbi:MAG TPA: VanW family protein [Candidatus Limnocylindrales bacterium]|nr:VanW family protein [Candidatus Limnocylindrales bacterium]